MEFTKDGHRMNGFDIRLYFKNERNVGISNKADPIEILIESHRNQSYLLRSILDSYSRSRQRLRFLPAKMQRWVMGELA